MKMFVKQFMPPLLLKVFKQLINTSLDYKSYEEASKRCTKDAYEGPDIVKVVVEKNLIFKQKIEKGAMFDFGALRTLIALGLSKTGSSLNVLDFGGGGGYHYTIASKALGDIDNLKWNVVETPAMATEAQRMANKNLKFFDNISEAQKDLGMVDLVFTSCALNYCPEPLSLLKDLINLKAKHLFITRTSFIQSTEKIVNIQKSYLSTNGPGPLPVGFKDRAIYYPIVFVSKQQVEDMISEYYDIRFTIIEDQAVYRVSRKEIDMFGYFCVLKT